MFQNPQRFVNVFQNSYNSVIPIHVMFRPENNFWVVFSFFLHWDNISKPIWRWPHISAVRESITSSEKWPTGRTVLWNDTCYVIWIRLSQSRNMGPKIIWLKTMLPLQCFLRLKEITLRVHTAKERDLAVMWTTSTKSFTMNTLACYVGTFGFLKNAENRISPQFYIAWEFGNNQWELASKCGMDKGIA